MSDRCSTRRQRGGFTLIEVLLVMVILVILGSLAVGVFSNTSKRARIDAAKADIGLIKPQVRLYETHIGELPPDLSALRNAPADPAAASKWAGPYLEKDPLDPWGQPYRYQVNADGTFEIWSSGPDQQPGTADDIYLQ